LGPVCTFVMTAPWGSSVDLARSKDQALSASWAGMRIRRPARMPCLANQDTLSAATGAWIRPGMPNFKLAESNWYRDRLCRT
jgi:hypothetical protein